ncbi:uncharacterized protein LY79DRAFT_591217 [Colletotrichum navitas]|uniref:Uncharacterized protein n=1 Tax=Colletotrichum navitas TaxID=681940 RepID=A0AAD8PXF4_9PEZI|nr:uncharacterized protein LY79DRAFT_591217 [Colletotrichum navitas]KAK1585943.1 hypothetical protein LY79DRAFT_591217 [Colletotrichum navitas]
MEIHPVSTAITKSPTATGAEEVSHDQAPTSDGLAPTLYAPSTSVPQLPPIVHLVHGRLGREKVYTVMSPDYDTPCIILVDMHWYSSSFTMKMLNGESLTTGVFPTARGKVGTYFGHNFLEVKLPSPLPTQTSGTKITMKCHMSPFQPYFINLVLIVKALRKAFHRKLVRRSGPKSGTGNSSMLPQEGFKSDGEDIVAFMADNSRWKPGHSFTLHFKASGLEGTLGEN